MLNGIIILINKSINHNWRRLICRFLYTLLLYGIHVKLLYCRHSLYLLLLSWAFSFSCCIKYVLLIHLTFSFSKWHIQRVCISTFLFASSSCLRTSCSKRKFMKSIHKLSIRKQLTYNWCCHFYSCLNWLNKAWTDEF